LLLFFASRPFLDKRRSGGETLRRGCCLCLSLPRLSPPRLLAGPFGVDYARLRRGREGVEDKMGRALSLRSRREEKRSRRLSESSLSPFCPPAGRSAAGGTKRAQQPSLALALTRTPKGAEAKGVRE
jgi:hypothetical protein